MGLKSRFSVNGGEYNASMTIFTRSAPLSALLCIALFAMLQACGNKGDLYLDNREILFQQISTVEDALDELELMEAEEE